MLCWCTYPFFGVRHAPPFLRNQYHSVFANLVAVLGRWIEFDGLFSHYWKHGLGKKVVGASRFCGWYYGRFGKRSELFAKILLLLSCFVIKGGSINCSS
jgi:hypothetical protein